VRAAGLTTGLTTPVRGEPKDSPRACARGVNGGGGGNRTRVPECLDLSFYARSSLFGVIDAAPTNRISTDQLDCFSSRLGRVANQRPACCVAPWPPADKGTSASRLVIKQRGSSACWHLSFSSRIYEVPGPRRATSGRINIRSKPIAPGLDADVIGQCRVQHKGRARSPSAATLNVPLCVSLIGVRCTEESSCPLRRSSVRSLSL
jgi:hypothetical protein